MNVRRVGSWALAARVLQRTARNLERSIGAALSEEAQALKTEITRGLTTQSPGGQSLARPSPITLAGRKLEGVGGQRALLATLELRRSISAIVRGLGAFVGVPKDARGSDGRSLVRVGEVQEFGHQAFVIRLTPAMRRFLGVLRRRVRGSAPSGRSSSGVIVVRIPARPFLRPAFARFARGSQVRFLRRLQRRLGLP
jgi:hypothetical protein